MGQERDEDCEMILDVPRDCGHLKNGKQVRANALEGGSRVRTLVIS